jgi:ferredoxin
MNNINKDGKNYCSSCGLCTVVCSRKAIDFALDKEGFYTPMVNENCRDCGICTKVCYKYLETREPFENTFKDKSIYAAWSKNLDVVLSSSFS